VTPLTRLQQVDILLFVLLAAIAVATLMGSWWVADAIYELSNRTVMVQCECR
jgi:hypothetical protein